MTAVSLALPPPFDGTPLTGDASSLPTDPGAYLLAIDLDRQVTATLGTLGTITVGPGVYLYAGSANGPGGIRARVRRHLAQEKTMHWHIDRLTVAASAVRAAAFIDDTECGLVRQLMKTGHVSTPYPGFGSSDCRTCPAHLLAVI